MWHNLVGVWDSVFIQCIPVSIIIKNIIPTKRRPQVGSWFSRLTKVYVVIYQHTNTDTHTHTTWGSLPVEIICNQEPESQSSASTWLQFPYMSTNTSQCSLRVCLKCRQNSKVWNFSFLIFAINRTKSHIFSDPTLLINQPSTKKHNLETTSKQILGINPVKIEQNMECYVFWSFLTGSPSYVCWFQTPSN